MPRSVDQDVIIIGGGPAGATAAITLARKGVRTLDLERATFPRFHIGESLLPRNFPVIRELGLEEKLRDIPHVPKLGVEFAMGDGSATARFPFDLGLLPGSETVNVERASFDAMLLDEARASGALVQEGVGVKRIVRLEDQSVVVEADGREISARWLIDASGQASVVARHLGTRRASTDPNLQKIAYFAHFDNVSRAPGVEGGYPCIAMADEGWFWIIPVDERRTSIGLVLDANVARSLDLPGNRILQWGIARCPLVRDRMRHATGPETNQVTSDYSYTCRPSAGPGYFLAGDAGAFLDPIFSTGVCLAMLSGQKAAEHVVSLLQGSITPKRARRQYSRYIEGSSDVFFRLIRNYYNHSFRELFLEGRGPHDVHRAILSILAGHVFPRPPFCLRWRLRYFEVFTMLNCRFQLVPRRTRFSLLNESSTQIAVAPDVHALGHAAE